MKAQYDEELIELTEGFLYAVELLMKEKVTMMKDAVPEYAECWHWGRCKISALASHGGMQFNYGGIDDMPDDGGGQFAVIVAI